MARRLKKLIKKFAFEESNRSELVLDGGVRLVPTEHYLELEKVDAVYPTTANLYAKTWVAQPECVKQWTGFESVHTNYRDESYTQVTDVKFRLSENGTTERFWNGSTWAVAAAGEWNTEAEVANNIGDFPVVAGARGLQVILNLSTTDSRYSPKARAVKVLYEGDVEQGEDLVYRSFKRGIADNVRPIAEVASKSNGSNTIVLATETEYDVESIDSVYNLTDDSERLDDLFQSYDSGTSTITLTAAQDVDDVMLVRIIYKPRVVFAKSQDYTEISKLPAIVIDRMVPVSSIEVGSEEHVINKSTNSGWQLSGGTQFSCEVTLKVLASKEKDAVRIGEAISVYVNDTPLLRLRATDEKVAMGLLEGYSQQTMPTQIGLNSGRIRVQLMNAVFYLGAARPVHVTASFQPTITGTH